MMESFGQKAIEQEADLIVGEVVSISHSSERVNSITLTDSTRIYCDSIVNGAGTRGDQIAAMTGLKIPVEPRKRTTFVFKSSNSPQGNAAIGNGKLPLMIDSSRVFCRPEGDAFLADISPDPDKETDPDDLGPVYDQFEDIWINLADRSKNFEANKMLSCWAEHYDYNTSDQNAIVGLHGQISHFYFANGFPVMDFSRRR
ncbi:MAG: FAD-binding oxidoreductase [Gammaproteobacteria bacterium]|nr:FAD-binding oxidoreductase [Gammaproteobacteria bacterium]